MRELIIDWPALHSAFQMNMPEVRCFLCLDDGRVVKVPPGDARLSEVRADTQRFVPIEAVPSRIQYQWLDDFIHSVADTEARGRMEAAINGKGAFRRFKDVLLTMPEQRRRWFEYRDIKMRERIVEWVAEQGVRGSNEAPWVAEDEAALASNNDSAPTDGSVASAPTETTTEAIGANDDVAALRDFLLSWSQNHAPEGLSSVVIESLAQEISQSFVVRSRA
ncbi:MAG: hypothetical protein H7Z43_05190 [Clostridia bacterium]|nr:hypothetical protein [Deltaproteobacteria bacterium]